VASSVVRLKEANWYVVKVSAASATLSINFTTMIKDIQAVKNIFS
jgi:hypothetical protein